MQSIIALNNFEIIKKLNRFSSQTTNIYQMILFIGPIFFILGMVKKLF